MNEERIHTEDPASLALIGEVRRYVPILMAKGRTPGLNIALADKGKLVWEAGFGLADIAGGRPYLCDTVFHSGSLGKVYTATAVMILVDRGVLALSDPINRHLPFEVQNPHGQREITIHDLLVHKSGLGDDAGAGRWVPGGSLADTLAREYALAVSPMQVFGPIPRWLHPVGEHWVYSNLGIATLGLIVEQANPEGLRFGDFVQRHILDPLGMASTQFPTAQHVSLVRPEIWAKASQGYTRMGGAVIPSLPLYLEEFPAGGAMCRPADHVRLLLAMLNGGEFEGCRLFDPSTAKQMLSPATEVTARPAPGAFRGLAAQQGLIWRLHDVGMPWESFDHPGGHMFGFRTEGRAWPHYGAAVVIAANQWSLPEDSNDTSELAEFVNLQLRYRPALSRASEAPLQAAEISYVRGILYAGAFRIVLGVDEPVPLEAISRVIAGTADLDGDWDGEAFWRGVAAVNAQPSAISALQSFWSSTDSEVDPATATRAYAFLGGRSPGFLAGLVPTEASTKLQSMLMSLENT